MTGENPPGDGALRASKRRWSPLLDWCPTTPWDRARIVTQFSFAGEGSTGDALGGRGCWGAAGVSRVIDRDAPTSGLRFPGGVVRVFFGSESYERAPAEW